MCRRGVPPLSKILFLVLLFLLAQVGRAGTVALVLSDTSAPYQEFGDSLADQFGRGNWSIAARGRADSPELGARFDVIVAAGSEAFGKVLARGGSSPVLATLITRATYEQVLAEHPVSRKVSAIFLDQPAGRQAAFIRQLLPDSGRVGMLGRRDQQPTLRQFRSAVTAQNQALEVEDSETDATFLPALSALLPRVDVFLAIPDTRLFNRESIRPLLITALRYKKPVIGYSPAMVSAGALAALYSSPAQIGQQAGELILQNGGQLPAPVHPAQFTVVTNRPVAEALGIEIRDESVIRRALSRSRETP